MTYRDRRQARADRLNGWADKRAERAEAAAETAHDMASVIPFGQPVLAGHHSQGRDQRYRARIAGTMDKAVEHADKAKEMASRAGNIEAQLACSIYDDDPNACEALTARIAAAEADRDRIKAYNASCRRGSPDVSLLAEYQRHTLASVRRVGQIRGNGSLPAYALTNLGARIRTDKERLARLSAEVEP